MELKSEGDLNGVKRKIVFDDKRRLDRRKRFDDEKVLIAKKRVIPNFVSESALLISESACVVSKIFKKSIPKIFIS